MIPVPQLTRLSRDGTQLYLTLSTHVGPAIARLPVTTGQIGSSFFSDPRVSIFQLPVASRLEILDFGEQPDGSLLITLQPDRMPTASASYYVTFRLPASARATTGTINVSVPFPTFSSSSSSTSSVTTTVTSSVNSATGGGSVGHCFLLFLLAMLAYRMQASRTFVTAIVLALATPVTPVFAAVGDLDTSFGDGGIARRVLGRTGSSHARLGVLGDGSLFYDPTFPNSQLSALQLMRLDANGRGPDTSLSWPGIESLQKPQFQEFVSLRQGSGGTLLPIWSNNNLAVLRLDRDGNPENGFGQYGVVTLNTVHTAPPARVLNFTQRIDALAAQADQRTLVAIGRYQGDFLEELVLRVDNRGNLDDSYLINIPTGTTYDYWDEGFVSMTPLYGGELRVVMYIRGTLYFRAVGLGDAQPTRWPFESGACGEYKGLAVVGRLADGDQLLLGIPTASAYPGFVMARVRADGTVNTSFGGASGAPRGFTCYQVPASQPGESTSPLLARLSADGRHTYVAISATAIGQGTRIVRLINEGATAGQLDPAFHGGHVDLPWISSRTSIDDLVEQPDGSLLVTTFNHGAFRLLGRDQASAGAIWIRPHQLAATEDAGVLRLVVTRSLGSDGPVSVDFSTADGWGTAGSDYMATSGSLHWASGETGEKTVEIPLLVDGQFEGTESLVLRLTNATGGAATMLPQVTASILESTSAAQTSGTMPAAGNAAGGGAAGVIDVLCLITLVLLAAPAKSQAFLYNLRRIT